MKDQTIPPLDVWLRDTIIQKTEETRSQVESNVEVAGELISDLGEEIRTEFPQYKTKVSQPFAYDAHEVLHQGVMGELTRLTVRQNRFLGRKVMTLDVLSHHEGNDVRCNFNEFNGPLIDENPASHVRQYFEDRAMYMWMK